MKNSPLTKKKGAAALCLALRKIFWVSTLETRICGFWIKDVHINQENQKLSHLTSKTEHPLPTDPLNKALAYVLANTNANIVCSTLRITGRKTKETENRLQLHVWHGSD